MCISVCGLKYLIKAKILGFASPPFELIRLNGRLHQRWPYSNLVAFLDSS